MSVGRRAVLVTALLVLVACSADSTGPVAGTLKVTLTSPNSGFDGAVLLSLSAPAVPASVTAAAGLTLWGAPVTATTTKLVLTGTLSSGTILTLQVDDVGKVSQYSVSLQQVAAGAAGGFLKRSLSGYSVSITK